MEEEKKISVVIPVYNTEKYIERCIYSILNQTYKDLEIICVDDGSTDKSGDILDRLSKEDSRIRVIHKKNEGVSVARNTALIEAKGDYIGFVDSDDYVDPRYYEVLSEALNSGHIDIVTCNYFIDYVGNIVKVENKKKIKQGPISTRKFLPYIYERDTYKGVASYLWTKLIKKELIKDENNLLKLRFQEDYAVAEDIIFLAELYLKSQYIQYIDIPLYYYYQREGSVSHGDINDTEWKRDMMKWADSYEWIISRYQQEGINKETIDIIKRMYVYRCGRLLELMIKSHDNEEICILKEKIKSELLVYIKTNLEHLDRIQWIIGLLL